MYIPISDYTHLTNITLDKTKFTTGDIPAIMDRSEGSDDTRIVYWDKTCDTVITPEYELTLELFDTHTSTNSSHMYTVTLSKDRLKVDGKEFGLDGKCVMPIFATWDTPTNSDNYYLGSHAMYEEYVVYDNHPYQKFQA